MSRQDDVQSLFTQALTVPLGLTLGVYMDQQPGEVTKTIKYLSGGTLWLIGCTGGATIAGATVAALGLTFAYAVGPTETLSFGGAARFYLAATGATVQVAVIRGISPG